MRLHIGMVCLIAACSGTGDAGRSAGDESALTQAEVGLDSSLPLQWGSPRDLDESDAAVLVTPAVTVDTRGGFLVADSKEAQVRRYSASGRLLWFTGRKGGGPGEYRAPRSVLRLANGDILVADRDGKLVRYDSAGSEVLATYPLPLERINEMLELPSGEIVVTGIGKGRRLAHVWNLATNTPVADFFVPEEHVENREAAIIVNWANVALAGDTIALLHSLSDSIYYYTTRGERLGAVRILTREFRQVAATRPPALDPNEWIETFDMMRGLWRLRDGTFLVLFATARPAEKLPPLFHLVHVTPDGRCLREGAVPQLLAVNPNTDSLYFVAPGAAVPNRWVSALLR